MPYYPAAASGVPSGATWTNNGTTLALVEKAVAGQVNPILVLEDQNGVTRWSASPNTGGAIINLPFQGGALAQSGAYHSSGAAGDFFSTSSPTTIASDGSLGTITTTKNTAPTDAVLTDLNTNWLSSTGVIVPWTDETNSALKFRVLYADGTTLKTAAIQFPSPTSGALSTVSPSSGVAFQPSTTREVNLIVPVTFNPTGAATATCLVQLSPDNVTYSTTVTKTFPISVALAGSIDEVTVRVPVAWYVKLTVTNATLGTGTYW